ncbi:MAG: carboxypeptidase-like regulatory domain-containing protein [Kofleriaceae bacterium]|nr:carboxypeptidase-like regulatory domain-containing protein [Kofleriaceae bacterium]
MRLPSLLCLVALLGADACGGSDAAPDAAPPDAAEPVTLSGTVIQLSATRSPVANATVSLRGAEPAMTTTTDAAGGFTLSVPPERATLVVDADTFTGVVIPLEVPTEGRSGVEIGLIASTALTTTMSLVGLTQDAAKGALIVEFAAPIAGGETATIDATSSAAFHFEGGIPTTGNMLASNSTGSVVFANVVPGEATVEVTPTPCVLVEGIATVPVDVGRITRLRADCNE